MHTALITLAIAAAVVLIHVSYVDFRFRYRDGIVWFWRLSPAPPMMWFGRFTIIAALLLALSAGWIGPSKTFLIVLSAVMLVHIVSLILLEVLEPR